MKLTDFGPRVAPFDHYLAHRGPSQTVLELGVDAGAHAESLLRLANVAFVDLVDPWPEEFYRGICKGRLDALGFYGRYRQHRVTAQEFGQRHENRFHAIYCDVPQDGQTASQVLKAYWPQLLAGGILAYRNYSTSWPDMKAVIDSFVALNSLNVSIETGEIILFK